MSDDCTVALVANTFALVQCNKNIFNLDYDKNIIPMKIKFNMISDGFVYKEFKFEYMIGKTLNQYIDIFSKLSLPDLKNILYMLIPFASDWTSSMTGNSSNEYVCANTLPHVKLAIKYVDDQIKLQNCDEIRNSVDLLNRHKELQNKYESLLSEYNSIKQMFTK